MVNEKVASKNTGKDNQLLKSNNKNSSNKNSSNKKKNNTVKNVAKNNNDKKTLKDTTKDESIGTELIKKNVTNKKNKQRQSKGSKPTSSPIKIAFLGGLNEVGKNMTLYEYKNEMILVDCGLAFPDQDMLGVDLVIPDFTYIEKNADKLKGIVITHGHEDHIGSLSYLLKSVNVPIYATNLTIGLISGKLKEKNMLSNAKLNVVKPKDKVKLGKFEVEFIHVNHSIPDAVALAIKTPEGTIIQTGDFKIDNTPIDGEIIDLNTFAQYGSEGVLCLLSDSTNAERPGYTESEKIVGESYEKLFRKAGNKRILVATFASNIHRVQQIIDVAKSLGRKVVLSGRSLENVVNIGSELGYLKIPEGVLVNLSMVNSYPPEKMVVITTGSQGEPMSALTRMAFSDHRKVEITPTDYVIISATPIPGNEKTVYKVINELLRLGAEVVYEKMYDVHVSGHACQEELKLILGITKPKYFIPVHGEQKHLQKHSMLAQSMGFDKKNIVIVDNGSCIEVTKENIKAVDDVPAGQIFVDGFGVGDVGNIVIRDRKRLSEDGLIVIGATIDNESRTVVSGVEIVSRGFVYVRESEKLMIEAKHAALGAIETCLSQKSYDLNMIRTRIRDDVSQLMYRNTKRSPMIITTIMEV